MEKSVIKVVALVSPDLIFTVLTTAAYLMGLLGLLGVLLWSAVRTFSIGVQYCQQLHQVPCHRCAYFAGDYRLRCTVHSSTALTKDAIGCLDYVPKLYSARQAQLLSPQQSRADDQPLQKR